MKALNLEGQRFTKLVVVRRHPENDKKGQSRWECKCDCGNETTVIGGDLTSSNTVSCGCLGKENRRKSLLTHGRSDSHEYIIWNGMIQRCHNEKNSRYARYGGRGIKVCERWRESFAAFYEDMGPRPTTSHSIERRENDKGYEPGNCIWATPKEQSNNKDSNVVYEIDGVKKTLTQWCEEKGVDYQMVRSRLRLEWAIEDALSLPRYARKPK